MAETYVNFFIPGSDSWNKLDLTRQISDYPGLQEKLNSYVKKEYLYQDYDPHKESETDYLSQLKIKISLFPDAVLGQMICAGYCSTLNPKTEDARFVRKFRSDVFKRFSYNSFDTAFSGFPGDNNKIRIGGVYFQYQNEFYSEVELQYNIIESAGGGGSSTAVDVTLTSIKLIGDNSIEITPANINNHINDQLVFSTDFIISEWEYLSYTSDGVLSWTPENTTVVYESIQRKTGINLSQLTDYQFYIYNGSSVIQDTSKQKIFLGYSNFSSFFFHLDAGKALDYPDTYTNTFNGDIYTTGDWLVPTSNSWELITSIAIVGSVNDQSSGGAIYTYCGSMTNCDPTGKSYTYKKGNWYYNDSYDAYTGNTKVSLINSLVLCTNTIHSSDLNSDEYEVGATDPITYYFSNYFITPNRTLTQTFLTPFSYPIVSEPAFTSNNIEEVLSAFDKWSSSLNDYLGSATGGSLPVLMTDSDGNDILVYEPIKTWGRHVVYFADGSGDIDYKYQTNTQPADPQTSQLNFYIEFPKTTN